MMDIDAIKQGFMEALEFAECGIDGECYGWSDHALVRLQNLVVLFARANETAIYQYINTNTDKDYVTIGHALYFNIAGHGVGFWEQSDEHAKKLDLWCSSVYIDVWLDDARTLILTIL